MARTIAEIQQSIIDAKNADSTLITLSSSSNVAIWKLWTYIVAVCQWTLESLFDAHKGEVQSIIALQKPHTLQWYVEKARAFQYGVSLPADSDVYSVVPPVDLSVMVVQNAAAEEIARAVRIKAARLNAGVLAALTSGQLTAFSTYMNRIKDAGVRLICTSGAPDTLQADVSIYYDPLVLDNMGARLDGTSSTPVKDAINTYLDNLPFNGLFVINSLIAAVQSVEGVKICMLANAVGNYALVSRAIMYEYTPDAGYMILDEPYFNAHITYSSHGPI